MAMRYSINNHNFEPKIVDDLSFVFLNELNMKFMIWCQFRQKKPCRRQSLTPNHFIINNIFSTINKISLIAFETIHEFYTIYIFSEY